MLFMKDIQSGLFSGNVCCHSVQHFLSYSFVSKNVTSKQTELRCCLLFYMGKKLGLSEWRRNID
jgi:hypothetical protein